MAAFAEDISGHPTQTRAEAHHAYNNSLDRTPEGAEAYRADVRGGACHFDS